MPNRPSLSPFGVLLVASICAILEGFFGIYFARKSMSSRAMPVVFGLSPGLLAFALFNGSAHLFVERGLRVFLASVASGYAITADHTANPVCFFHERSL
jgi:hypothetical protein